MGHALISGVIVAALSGLTFLAYRDHPAAYEKVNRLVAAILIMALIGGGFWNFGVVKTLQVLVPYVSPAQETNAVNAAESLQVSSWYLLAAVSISVYCILLPVIFRAKNHSGSGD